MPEAPHAKLLQLIYASAAIELFTEGNLRTLLLRARLNNERRSISGILLFEAGSFLQVLEGPASEVMPLFAKIGGDKRHNRVVKLSEKWIEKREFGDWSMGYVPSDRNIANQLRGFNDFFRWSSDAQPPDAAGALRIVGAFRDGRFRVGNE